MKTYDSKHYSVKRYIPDRGWEIVSLRDDSFIIIARCAKFVDAGKVVYLKEDGSAEDKARKKISFEHC